MPFSLDAEFVARAELKLGARLPNAYVERMRHANGGSVEIGGEDWELHPILDETDDERIARTSGDILRETEEARGWVGFPEAALSIASNGSGDQLVLLRTGTDQYDDTLYVWNHETRKLVAIATAREVF